MNDTLQLLTVDDVAALLKVKNDRIYDAAEHRDPDRRLTAVRVG